MDLYQRIQCYTKEIQHFMDTNPYSSLAPKKRRKSTKK